MQRTEKYNYLQALVMGGINQIEALRAEQHLKCHIEHHWQPTLAKLPKLVLYYADAMVTEMSGPIQQVTGERAFAPSLIHILNVLRMIKICRYLAFLFVSFLLFHLLALKIILQK